MARIATLALTLALLALPASALAQATNVPPGNSEADQYFETVPDGTGNAPIGNSNEPSDVLTPEQIDALEELGPDGADAAALAAATAPDGGGQDDSAGQGDGSSGPAGDETDGSDGALPGNSASAAAGAPSRDGLGDLLWVLLIAAGLAGGLYIAARRRSAEDA